MRMLIQPPTASLEVRKPASTWLLPWVPMWEPRVHTGPWRRAVLEIGVSRPSSRYRMHGKSGLGGDYLSWTTAGASYYMGHWDPFPEAD